jgi:two-component system, LuxR family, sensor kinase FixL
MTVGKQHAVEVLIVEDDADTRENLRDILELDEYRVGTAASATEALSHADLARVAAVILDRRLPDQSAEELLPSLKQAAPDAAVIVVTGYAELDSAISALRLGAADYLLKPVNPDALRASLSRILEQRQTKEALRERESRLQAILDTAAEGIITINEYGIVEAMNPAAARIFGYDASEVVGQNVSMLMPSPYREEHDEYLQRFLKSGQSENIGRRRELQARRRDGTVFPVELTVSEVCDSIRGFTGILRDITERKRAEERLLQAERLAAIGEAMAGLAHESRNALQRSQACLEMLRINVAGDESSLDLISRIQAAQDDLHRLYEEVRGYAAPVKLNRVPCDLGGIVRQAWEHLDSHRTGRDVHFREEHADLDLVCEVDEFALRQVFRNIFENALAACCDPVEITVSYAESRHNGAPVLRISIGDNGPGLSTEAKQHIFEPFFTTKTRGTGLGMAICRRFVEVHGGAITVVERSGRGAKFDVILPRRAS